MDRFEVDRVENLDNLLAPLESIEGAICDGGLRELSLELVREGVSYIGESEFYNRLVVKRVCLIIS